MDNGRLRIGWAPLAVCLLLAKAFAADLPKSTNLLTLDRIFKAAEFRPEPAPSIQWSKRYPGHYYSIDSAGEGGPTLVLTDVQTGTKEVVAPSHTFIPAGEAAALRIDSYAWSEDESLLLIYTNSKRVWRANTRGDYWVLDVTGRDLKKLGGNAAPSTLMFAKFSPDSTRVAYVRENNLYVQSIRDLSIIQLTKNGSATIINGTFDWVYEEELDLRDGFRWSPDGSRIAYWELDSSGVKDFTLLNNTAGMYPKPFRLAYPKTGEQNSSARIGVIAATGSETTWMKIPGDSREHYLARMDWFENSDELLIQQFNRRQNTNLVFAAKAGAGDVRLIHTETDAAWIDNDNPIRWLKNSNDLLWLSDSDGWRHTYRLSATGKGLTKVNQGNFDLVQVEAIDQTNRWLYYLAAPRNPTQRYLFRVGLSGGRGERLTPRDQPGSHQYNISRDGKFALHSYSSLTNPPTHELISLPDHKVIRKLGQNEKLREKLQKLDRPQAEFFQIDIGEEVQLDAYVLRPPKFDPGQKYPLLFHVYGEPHGQTVRDTWGGDTSLWHWMLAQKGVIVVSVDNRGTFAPRGRAFRKSIYKRIGILNISDQAAAARALLKKWPYVDASRIGIWGWSGGGSSTLNALMQFPEIYKMGMAIAAVPNQRLYDTIYQERYMALPGDNPDGYRKGSPLAHASKLKGDLLIVHGTGDDNVHYQGAEAMINELVAYNKVFTMMSYPNRTHGIGEGRNTTFHLYGLLTRFVENHLIAKVDKRQNE